jgi:hypothetical protein
MVKGPDIFISYKSQQNSWAARLSEDLDRYGYTVFVDHDTAAGLKVGQAWEQQITHAIRHAEHFLVLWSDLITVGSYVLKEIDIRRQSGRPVVVVRLDDSEGMQILNTADHEFREFVDLHTAAEVAAEVGFFEWNRAVRHLVDQVLNAREGGGRIIEIPVVVIAMTRDQAREVATGKRIVHDVRDGAFARLMDLLRETVPFDSERYGDRPEAWHPFEPDLDVGDPSVEEVIYEFDRAQRRWYREHAGDRSDPLVPHVFVNYGCALRNPRTRTRARDRVQDGPALVVFDPISLVHEAVHAEVISNGLHTLNQAFVIGLGPRISSALPPVRTYLTDLERALFDGLMMTDPHERARAPFRPTLSTCVLNVGRSFELSRWIQVASESILTRTGRARTRMAPAYEPYLRQGPQRLPTMGGQ